MEQAHVQVVDTGLAGARDNIAMDRAWLLAHAAGQRPDLLRFYRSGPSAWVGQHQWPDYELRLQYCRRKHMGVVRRLSGGGSLYVDEHQLGWSLILHSDHLPASISRARLLSECAAAVAEALCGLGIEARQAGFNDVEVDGRKIASVFFAQHEGSLLLHGTVLLQRDPGRVIQTLRLPTEQASAGPYAVARDRLTSVQECCRRAPVQRTIERALAAALLHRLNLRSQSSTKRSYALLRDFEREPEALPGLMTPLEIETKASAWRKAASGAVPEALWQTEGGLLRARADLNALRNSVRGLHLAGGVQCFPSHLFETLQAELEEVPLSELDQRVRAICSETHAELVGFSTADIVHVIRLALDRIDQRKRLGLTPEQSNRVMIMGDYRQHQACDILGNADAMLIPYCAKPVDCAYRDKEGCDECGKCDVGDLYRLGREHGLRMITLQDYQDLPSTFAHLRAKGVHGLLGMCCQQLFVKRNQVFRDAGIPMVLFDIHGANCHEQGKERQAYRGKFKGQSGLDLPVVERTMRFIPHNQLPTQSG